MPNLLLWSEKDEEFLRRNFRYLDKEALMAAFPERTWKAIQAKAARLTDKKGKPKKGVSWTTEERLIIKKHWRHLDKRVIRQKYLPHRTLASIEGQARRLGLTSERVPKISQHTIVQQLIRERIMLGWTRKEVARRAGYEEHCIAEWERGDNMSALSKLIDWAQALGFDLVLIPKE